MKFAILIFAIIALFATIACNTTPEGKTNPENTVALADVSTNVVDRNVEEKNVGGGTVVEDAYVFIDTIPHPTDEIFASGYCIRLPKIVADDEVVALLNKKILSDFDEITKKAKQKDTRDAETFVKVDYQHWIIDSVLCLLITEQNAIHLSEGTTRFEIYHYSIVDKKILTTNDLLQLWGMSQVPLLNAIVEQIAFPPDFTEPLFTDDWFETIKWNDINKLKIYKDKNNQLTVIFPLVENGIEDFMVIK